MNYDLLRIGDRVLAINNSFLAIERSDGSVDLYPVSFEEEQVKINANAVTTIGYPSEEISEDIEEFVTDNDVHVVNF